MTVAHDAAVRREYPLAACQTNILHVERTYAHLPVNNVCAALVLTGQIDARALTEAARAVCVRVPVLRTRLTQSGAQTRQYLSPDSPPEPTLLTFKSRAAFDAYLNKEAAQPFSPLYDAPLCRVSACVIGRSRAAFVVCAHHVITDAWSQGLLAEAFEHSYAALLAGNAPEWTDMPAYEAHVTSEQAYRSTKAYQKDRAFWQERVRALPPLPALGSGGSAEDVSAARFAARMPDALCAALNAFCASRRVSPFIPFAVALSAVLCRTHDLPGLCVGVPVLGRHTPEEKRTAGMFVSTLPLYVPYDGALSFQSAADAFQTLWLDTLRHERLPFDDIHELSRQQGLTGELFDIALSYQTIALGGERDGVRYQSVWAHSGAQAQGLEIHLSDRDARGLTVEYDYQCRRFDQAWVRALHARVRAMLSALLHAPDAALAGFPLVNVSEKRLLTNTYLQTSRPLPDETLAQRLSRIAHEKRVHPAVISGSETLSHLALYHRACEVAAFIQKRTQTDDVIALLLPRGADLLVMMCGVLLSGRAFQILDNTLPNERLRQYIQKSGARLLLTDSAEDFGIPSAAPLDAFDTGEPAPEQGELAYVICTSGSTGEPKAIAVRREGLMNFVCGMQDILRDQTALSLCASGFDAFLLETLCVLLCGGTVVMTGEDERSDPRALSALLVKHQITFICSTPSRLLAYIPVMGGALASLKAVVCGGEAFPPALPSRLAQVSDAALYNQYGPSETTIGVSIAQVCAGAPVTAGKPMPNCRLYVCSQDGALLPPGEAGELVIAGACVAKGYLSCDTQTERAFVTRFGQRAYRSGDRARWTENGEIVILGRMDSQVKLRGYRIELGEIERVMLSVSGVDGACVRLRGNALYAYYTGQTDDAPVWDALRVRLPRYMLPVAILHLDALPLSRNGKVDDSLLPAPPQDVFIEPENDLEREMTSLFARVLGRDRVSAAADFYLHGGDSLQALRLLMLLEEEKRVRLPLARFQSASTPRALAKMLKCEPSPAAGAYPRAPEQRYYPLSPSQRSFYVLWQVRPESVSYNMPGLFRCEGALDRARLTDAMNRLIALNEGLRTRFVSANGEIVQEILPNAPFALEQVDADAPLQAFERFVRPFDLARAPLLRAGVYGNGGETYLLLDMHHIVSDGASCAILFEQLNELYKGLSPEPPRARVRDYACALSYNKNALDAQRAYWQKLLENAPPATDLPTDYPRPAIFCDDGDTVHGALSDALCAQINEYCARSGVTPFLLTCAAWAALLSRLSSQEDVVLGVPVTLRSHPDLSRTVGAFVGTLPLRLGCGADTTFAQLLRQGARREREMLDNRDVTLDEIIARCGIAQNLSQAPLCNMVFSYPPQSDARFMLEKTALVPVTSDRRNIKYDLCLEVTARNGRYTLSLEYPKALYMRMTADMLLRCYQTLLEDALSDDSRALCELRVTAPEDEERLVTAPERLRVPFEDALIDHIIDDVCEKRASEPAVSCAHSGEYTYGDLRRRATTLAGYLRQNGVTRGDCVGLLCHRTGDMPAALYGILKAGAAYVPLDAAYPEDRIRYMMEESRARVLLLGEGVSAPENLPCRVLPLRFPDDASYAEPSDRQTDDPFYVLYTSGSTGRPKGVTVMHHGIASLLATVRGMLDFDARVLCVANVIFDIFTIESMLCFALGKRVIMADEDEMALPWRMAERMRTSNVNVLQLTPSRMQMCLSDESFRKTLAQLKVVILAGEPWGTQLLDTLRSLSKARIYNIYGPTETTVFSGVADLTEADCVHIGKPVFNSRFYALDARMRRLPPLCRGEIYIAGECVARGYINRPDLTAQTFLRDAFRPDDRMYKTGDIAHLRADGNWVFHGRRDKQIKMNGHRIESDEITAQVLKSGLADEAALTTVQKNGEIVALRVFLVPHGAFREQALRDYLAPRLPDYMMPAYFTALSALPRTASGKTDLIKLSAMPLEQAQSDAREACDEPHTALGRALSDIWKEVLGVPRIDPHRTFFSQGGSSLTALTVLSKYFRRGYSMTLGEFYQHGTIAAQEALLSHRSDASVSVSQSAQTAVMPMPRANQMKRKPGACLLTGASGYLGAHLLRGMLDGGEQVVCLARDKKRVIDAHRFYFGCDPACDIIPGDITQARFGLPQRDYAMLCARAGSVLHAAADVRHYAAYEDLARVNVQGTQTVIQFCTDASCDLHHVSTLSVSGSRIAGDPEQYALFTETDLDIGQNAAQSPYLYSKLEAEKRVAAAMEQSGLSAHIYRVGRLTPRASDGVFQQNPDTNAFFLLVRGVLALGAVPESAERLPVAMAPVDECARALLCLRNAEDVCYHLECPHALPLLPLLCVLGTVAPLEDTAFRALLQKRAPSGGQTLQLLQNALAGGELERSRVYIGMRDTLRALAAQGFIWSEPDAAWLEPVFCMKRKEGIE